MAAGAVILSIQMAIFATILLVVLGNIGVVALVALYPLIGLVALSSILGWATYTELRPAP